MEKKVRFIGDGNKFYIRFTPNPGWKFTFRGWAYKWSKFYGFTKYKERSS